jgi:uncharacterized membrane protein
MRSWIPFFYTLILSLWTGGMVLFTFIVTPAIFRAHDRDLAGRIVGSLFDGYFLYLLLLSGLSLFLLFLLRADRKTPAFRASLALIIVALLVNTYVTVKLHPSVVQVKQQVASFQSEEPSSPARRKFGRLHAVGAALNLAVLLDGVALLALSRRLFPG